MLKSARSVLAAAVLLAGQFGLANAQSG
ncbi:MAG: hypothetical protein RIS35_2961, partial [Pseudomonadota bacterium]